MDLTNIQMVYETLFELNERKYKATGGIDHQVLGITLSDNKIKQVNAMLIDEQHMKMVSSIVGAMLKDFSVVVHISEAWVSGTPGTKPSEAADKKDVVMMVIYTEANAFMAMCEVNESNKTITKGELIESDLHGRMVPKRDHTIH